MLEKQNMDKLRDLRNFTAKTVTSEQAEILENLSRLCKLDAVMMTGIANSGHPAGSMSGMDIYNILLAVMDMTPANCCEFSRDRVVVSHGHTSPGVYAALAAWGFVERDDVVSGFRRAGSAFQGHVEREVPGVDWSTGNLGQGLSAGVGLALANRARGNKASRVFVVMGDGEQPKGQNAEARRIAAKEKLSSMTVLIDYNQIQISGSIHEVMPADITALWKADGWTVFECDGHDYAALYETLRSAAECGKPAAVICRTVMGKGVSFMENVPDYHGKAASGELLADAITQLGGGLDEYERLKALAKQPPAEGRGVCFCPVSIDPGEPVVYTAQDKKDNRGAFGAALADVAKRNMRVPGRTPILAFDCDLAESVKLGAFARLYPDSFVQTGIQEHATATVAGAAGAAGVVSVWAAFGVFGLDEVYNQQRLNDINASSLKTVLTHVGLDVGEDGKTHQCIDYIGLPRNIFGWRVVVPADPNQTDRATRWMLAEPGNICLAMGRSMLPVLLKEDGTPFFGADYKFKYGAIDVLRRGEDAAILAMGHMAGAAVAASDALAAEGARVTVLHASCPLGMDAGELLGLLGDRPLVTCEDHHVDTGLGSIAAMMIARAGRALPLKNLGVTRYGESGPSKDVLARMGLCADGVAEAVRQLL